MSDVVDTAVVQEVQPTEVTKSEPSSPKKDTSPKKDKAVSPSPKKDSKKGEVTSSSAEESEATSENSPSGEDKGGVADDVAKTSANESAEPKDKLTKSQKKNRARAAKKALQEEGKNAEGVTEKAEEPKATGPVKMAPDVTEGAADEKLPRKRLTNAERRQRRAEKATLAAEAAPAPAEAAPMHTEPPLPKRERPGAAAKKDTVAAAKTDDSNNIAGTVATPAATEATEAVANGKKKRGQKGSATTALPAQEVAAPAPASAVTPAADVSGTEGGQKKGKSKVDKSQGKPNPSAEVTPAPTTTASAPAPTVEASGAEAAGLKKGKRKGAKTKTESAQEPAPAAPQATTATTQPATQQAVVRLPALKVDQHIALHAIVNVLQQGIRTDTTHVVANSATMKAHLLHAVTQLGYTCIEGSLQSFQRVGWYATGNMLDFGLPILKSPEQFVQTTKTKGDLKLEAPTLFVQCRAFPNFGAESPLLQGAKVFKERFLRSVDEVAMGETDVFLFAAAESVYQELALSAVPSLPEVTIIKSYATTFALPHHTNKGSMAAQLRCLAVRVVTVSDDKYIVAALLP